MTTTRRYICRACKRSHAEWVAQCKGCFQYRLDAVEEESAPEPEPAAAAPQALVRQAPQLVAVPTTPTSSPLVQRSSVPIPITDVEETTFKRYLTNIEPLDRVLGGGLVVGSVIVLGGEPGSGKSSLGMQALKGIGRRCLYATGEESVAQAAHRARRIEADSPDLLIVAETDLDIIFEHALNTEIAVLLIDSMQTLTCSSGKGGAGSVTMVRECAHRIVQFAKAHDIVVIVVGHVTSDGSLAGPKTLTHLVDVVLEFALGDVKHDAEGDEAATATLVERDERVVSCPTKNRFGAIRKRGRFVMTSSGLLPIEEERENPGFH